MALGLPALLAPPTASAGLVEQTRAFFIQPASSTQVGLVTEAVSGVVGATATRSFSGNFVATFVVDNQSLGVANFLFDEGEILTSGYTLELLATVQYAPPIGSAVTYIIREPHPDFPPAHFRLTPLTFNAADGALLPDGTLDNSQYFLFADRGSQVTGRTVSNAVIGSSIQPPVLVNYTISPALLPFRGTATPSIEEISSTIHQRTIRATLDIEFNEFEDKVLPGLTASLNLPVVETELGTVTAQTGTFAIPTDYADWAGDNGLDQPAPEDPNPAGIAYGILYALDLPADATSLPIGVANTPAGPVVTITLPDDGLRNALGVEYSPDLATPDWPDLPVVHFLDGADSLDRDATGEARFSFPAGDTGFLRFTTTLE